MRNSPGLIRAATLCSQPLFCLCCGSYAHGTLRLKLRQFRPGSDLHEVARYLSPFTLCGAAGICPVLSGTHSHGPVFGVSRSFGVGVVQ
jgi:hypothetical protein